MKKFSEFFSGIQDNLQGKKFLGISLDKLLIKSSFALILIIVIASMLPRERPFEYSNLTVGSVSGEEIIAPFTFPIIKSDAVLEKERREARLRVPPVFTQMTNKLSVQKIKMKQMFDEFGKFFNSLDETHSFDAKSEKNLILQSRVDSLVKQLYVKYNVNLGVDEIAGLFDLFKAGRLKEYQGVLEHGLNQIYSQGIINIVKSDILENKITVMKNGIEEEYSPEQVLDAESAREKLLDFIATKYKGNELTLKLAGDIASAFVIPDLMYNQDLSTARKEKAVHDVPTSSGFIHKNERIVDEHEIITDDIYLKLQSYAQALQERTTLKKDWHHALFYLGKYIFAILMTMLLGFLIWFYRPQIFRDNKMLLLITTVILLQFMFKILVSDVLGWSYLSIPILLGPMMLAMLFDGLIAFWGTILISFVLGASHGNNYYLALLVLIVGTISLFSVQKIRNRGQMFRAIFYILVGYALVNLSYGFIHYESFGNMFQSYVFYQVPNAILAPTAVFLLIGIFERFFDVTTDITLLELSDLNHPLLKRLSVEAPGTFHHSFTVGNLAEAAAKEISANSLLARVGCYYHDIGKMLKSEYFVENQVGTVNKHENLTPSMSCLILGKHVKAGLDLAEKYGLPSAVKKFIPEHHGTSLMTYFYHKAQETMNPKDINEDDFRYPGPKPQSKETAISMLADTVEAASRSLTNPNLQRIRLLVDNLIEKKFKEGELDECDLTLRELNKIKDAFVHVLMGIHHLRIEYPSGEGAVEKSRQTATEKSKKKEEANAKKAARMNGIAVPSPDPQNNRDKVEAINNSAIDGKRKEQHPPN